MQPERAITAFAEVLDEIGTNRLILRFVQSPLPTSRPEQKAYDFHSLAWEVRSGDDWTERLVISRADFERDGVRRWVSALFSLNSDAGTAIIQVAEEQPRDSQGVVSIGYSWQQWDLVCKSPVSVLRACADPFEPFDGPRFEP
jgi:hypothetical protein